MENKLRHPFPRSPMTALQQYESKGETAFDNQNLTFEQLADRYRDAKMIEAEFVGERKVAGMRAQFWDIETHSGN